MPASEPTARFSVAPTGSAPGGVGAAERETLAVAVPDKEGVCVPVGDCEGVPEGEALLVGVPVGEAPDDRLDVGVAV